MTALWFAIFFIVVGSIVTGMLVMDRDMHGSLALFPMLIISICLVGVYIETTQYAEEQARVVADSAAKAATIQCKTAECPYTLETQDDSTRIWVKRE